MLRNIFLSFNNENNGTFLFHSFVHFMSADPVKNHTSCYEQKTVHTLTLLLLSSNYNCHPRQKHDYTACLTYHRALVNIYTDCCFVQRRCQKYLHYTLT